MDNQITLSGKWKYSLDGETSPWFDNLILDSGLTEIVNNLSGCPFYGSNALFNKVVIGHGSTAPVSTDTVLEEPLFEEAVSDWEINTASGNAASITLTSVFTKGSSFTISELGLNGDALFSRVVIPPLTVLANEILTVSYEITISATSGSGHAHYTDGGGNSAQSNINWCIPKQSLINGLTEPFFLPQNVYCSPNMEISESTVSNLETEVFTSVTVTPSGKSFNVAINVPLTANVGSLQIGGISDMLSTFFNFDPLITGVTSFTFNFKYTLGDNQ